MLMFGLPMGAFLTGVLVSSVTGTGRSGETTEGTIEN